MLSSKRGAMLKRISSKQAQLRSSGPRNGFNGSHYMQVTRSRHRGAMYAIVYTWIFSTIFPSLDLSLSLFFFVPGETERILSRNGIVINISRKRYQGPVIVKKKTKMGGWKVEIVAWSRSGRDDRKRISFASQTFLQKFRQFSSDSRTLFAKSPRYVLLSSCQFEM